MERYLHGWGNRYLDARVVVCSWALNVFDIDKNPTAITFDLVDGDSLLIIGWDDLRDCDIINRTKQRYVERYRPQDTSLRFVHTYMVPNNERLLVQVARHLLRSVGSLMANGHSLSQRDPLVFTKCLHSYMHAKSNELQAICKDADILTETLEDTMAKVAKAFEISARTGRPISSKNLSVTHVNERFNQEIQIDFTF